MGIESQGVLYRGICLAWFHGKCTDLNSKELRNVTKSRDEWFCESCSLLMQDDKDGSSIENVET